MYDIRIIYMVFRKEDSMNLLNKVNSPKDIKGMSIEELKTRVSQVYVLETHLKLDLYMSISHHVSIKGLLTFLQELQSNFGDTIECQFNFKITQKTFCEIKVMLW